MDRFKKICKALLFPHLVIRILLLPMAMATLICSLIFLDSESPVAMISYVLSAYTLTVWCVQIPRMIQFAKSVKNENKYAVMLAEDVRLRVNISLYGSFVWNAAYAALQLGLGLYHGSFWFYSMAGYYILLAFVRFFLVRHTSRYLPGEKMHSELVKYRLCGFVFLVMNVALSVMIFFMVYLNRTFEHSEITTITLATYTFVTFTVAVINVVKYRKWGSPVFSASKAISLAAASVSMLTLTSTMLTTFGEADGIAFRRLMLGLLGGGVSVFIIAMAVYMIVGSTKKLRRERSKQRGNV